MNIEERFNYYIKNWKNKQTIKINNELKKFKQNELIYYSGPNTKRHDNFPKDLSWEKMFWWNQPELPLDIKCLTISADGINNQDLPALAKVRLINNPKGSILIPASYGRHWGNIPIAKKNNIKWNDKISECIWRGVSTGNTRINFCKLYSKKYNVGITKFIHGAKTDPIIFKENISIDEFLKYKYIISIPGNDKDSGINWKLASKSVVLMAKPQIESWLMEGLLKPYIHYIPLKDDYSDLDEIITWCKNNDNKCQEIVINANNFMKQFEDFNVEKEIFNKIKNYYSKNFILN